MKAYKGPIGLTMKARTGSPAIKAVLIDEVDQEEGSAGLAPRHGNAWPTYFDSSQEGSGEDRGFDGETISFSNSTDNNTIDSNNTRGGIQESLRGAQPENITEAIGLILTKGDEELPDGIQDLIAWYSIVH